MDYIFKTINELNERLVCRVFLFDFFIKCLKWPPFSLAQKSKFRKCENVCLIIKLYVKKWFLIRSNVNQVNGLKFNRLKKVDVSST